MRVVSLLFVCISLSLVSAQEEGTKNQQQGQQEIPVTLAEAHAELERILPPDELARIDAMPSEGGMIQYHFGLGAGIRYRWGLSRGSALAKHMQELGFTHPDDMSSVILDTFWCKRHAKDLRLKERAARYKKYWDATMKAQGREGNRVQEANAAIRNMMMGLRFEKQDVPVVRIPIKNGLNVRFLSRFRGGVFLAAYCQGSIPSRLYAIRGGLYLDSATGRVRTQQQYDDGVTRGFYRDPTNGELRKMKPGEDFYLLGFYFDLASRKIHSIRVAEVNEVYTAVVAGDRAWFGGLTNGKNVLIGVGERDRIAVPLPEDDEIPDLGMEGQSLLAVYSKTIFRLTDHEWALVHSGDILLPRSGLPPQLHGSTVFLRDEERRERGKRLWWLTLGKKLHLSVLDRDVGVVAVVAPTWRDSSSYCVTRSGDLWACVGEGMSLLRRSQDGHYSIAILNGSIQFREDVLDSRKADPGLSISAVTALPDGTLLLGGNTGLYRLKGSELTQELAFIPERTTDSSGRVIRDRDWNPNTILVLDDQSYVIGCDSWNGVYLLRKDDGHWRCLPLDDVRDTVVW